MNGDAPNHWVFPSISFAPGEYLLVLASGKDRVNGTRPLHTNFRLKSTGLEYLALADATGRVVWEHPPHDTIHIHQDPQLAWAGVSLGIPDEVELAGNFRAGDHKLGF